jgi:hypothetical protein
MAPDEKVCPWASIQTHTIFLVKASFFSLHFILFAEREREREREREYRPFTAHRNLYSP